MAQARYAAAAATVFIDRQGVIRDVVLGPVSQECAREALKKAGAAITRLEKEP